MLHYAYVQIVFSEWPPVFTAEQQSACQLEDYTIHLSKSALNIHVSVCLAAIPSAALISLMLFCYCFMLLQTPNLLDYISELSKPQKSVKWAESVSRTINQEIQHLIRNIPQFYARIGLIYHVKKFRRLALPILHSFSIHIHYCLCSSPNYILFGKQQTPNRLSSHSPLSKNIIIGRTDGYFKNGQLFSFWLNLKARVSIRGQFHIEKSLNQFINNKLAPYCCLRERVLAANSPCAYSFTL